ncbi:hypothetical protein APR12_006759 [Nocardia amikacinitolerans]|uniref:hypothetical protein n=1 Tax=Nocardia amikacinitolerans TaxID=756689 RepID=UPI00083681A9|nr:hypothetical protein [Nocardia amikacinitolerans]MCP2321368.1 hypothetical protein [Nocardia amikacinitolerans]
MGSSDGECWPYGRRPKPDWAEEFTGELKSITINAPMDPNPDGSVPTGRSDRLLLQAELVKRMKLAHQGRVSPDEYEQVRWGDAVVELKFPRPGHEHGWHYRLYTGVPKPPDHDYLVWLGAGRKPDDQYDPEGAWRTSQTDQIDTSEQRFKVWINARFASRL